MPKNSKKEKNINKNSNKNVINIKINTHKKSNGKSKTKKKSTDTPLTSFTNTQQPLPHYNRAQDYRDTYPFGNQIPIQVPISKPISSPIATSNYFDTTSFRTLDDISTIHNTHSSKHSTMSDVGDNTWQSYKSEPSIKSEDIPYIFSNPKTNPFFSSTVPLTEEGTFNSIINNDESSLSSMIPITSETPRRYIQDDIKAEKKEKNRLKNQENYENRMVLVAEIQKYDPDYNPSQKLGKKNLKEVLDILKQEHEMNLKKKKKSIKPR